MCRYGEEKCGEIAREHNIALHVDGARIWNAAASLGVSPARCVRAADSVSVCLSKGLGRGAVGPTATPQSSLDLSVLWFSTNS